MADGSKSRRGGGGIRNELIELATAFYSLVDAGRGEGRDGGRGKRRGEELVIAPSTTARRRARAISREGEGVLSWLRAPLTDSVRVAFPIGVASLQFRSPYREGATRMEHNTD